MRRISKFWLKLIGTREGPCPDRYERSYADSRRTMRGIRSGDSIVLYAVGRGKRVFALATVTREAYKGGAEGWPYRVDLSYEVNLPVSAGVSIDEVSTAARDLVRSIKRAAYIELRPEEFQRAAALLRAAGGAQNVPMPEQDEPKSWSEVFDPRERFVVRPATDEEIALANTPFVEDDPDDFEWLERDVDQSNS